MDFTDKIFLTFDIDWAVDEVLRYTYEIVRKHDIKATFFITHDTPILDILRVDKNIELGIHPNFNNLLNSQPDLNYKQIINNLLSMEPGCVSYRSHSLTSSTLIGRHASKFLKYDLNCYIPFGFNIVSKPFLNHYQMYTVPHFFEDDLEFNKGYFGNNFIINKMLDSKDSLKVFDFHPIHIFLNTECMRRYEEAKLHYKDWAMLQNYINKTGSGTMDFLLELIVSAKQRGFEFLNICDIVV